MQTANKKQVTIVNYFILFDNYVQFLQGDSEGVWSKRVDEVNQQLRKSEAEKNNLSKNLKAAEKECSDVKSQLQDLNKALSGNDNVSKELEVKLKVCIKS